MEEHGSVTHDRADTSLEGLPSKSAPAVGICGAALLVAGFLLARSAGGEALPRFFQGYFVAFCFFLTISLGALFFVLLQHLVKAGWSVVVRRIAEILAVNHVVLAVLFLPVVLWGMPHLFPWIGAGAADLNPKQAFYLSPGFFLLRCAVYFVVWSVLSLMMWRNSLEQDRTGSPSLSMPNQKISAPGMILFGVTLTFAAIDLLMSMNPHWASTVFGVYIFAGSAVAFFAAMILLCLALGRGGRLGKEISVEHYHDLGKLLFTFVFFWSYIAYSQYMLVWYAQLPDETSWFAKRASPTAGGWNVVSLVLLFGHWLLPFVALLSVTTKRNVALLAAWAVWLLAMHYVDLYWIVMPEWHASGPAFHAIDLVCMIGVGSVYLGAAGWLAGRRSLLAKRDPRLAESLAFENM